jgi:dTDP-4-amino-4,6-dideoxygalactose transaminase
MARSVVNQGRVQGKGFFEHYWLGTNLRMTAFQAAVLLAQFENLSPQIEQRTANANRIRRQIPSGSGIVWQAAPLETTRNSHYLLLGRIQNAPVTRDRFCGRLAAAGVPITPFYPHTLYRNPLYLAGGCRVMPCPISEACINDAFWLPHRVLLADEESIGEVIAAIEEALKEGKGTTAATTKKTDSDLAAQTASRPGAAS